MAANSGEKRARDKERGSTLLIVAGALVLLLGMAGLAIDLVSLYVARSEAQRAADAAALAGAKVFMTSGCTSSTGGCSSYATEATNKAIDVGNRNLVGNQNPDIQSGDVTFDFSNPDNPRITVIAKRSSTHIPPNPMPTFFMKIFGVEWADVSATATAEAYNPTNSGGPPVGAKCLKPWVLANCDWNNMVPSGSAYANPNCPDPGGSGTFASYFPGLGGDPSRNVLGQLLTIKPGQPNEVPTPGKFYPIFLPPGTIPSACPDCATGGGSGGTASGSLYRNNIECCNQNTISCGEQTVQPITGNMVGPTSQGVDCLIHQAGGGGGQDTLNTSTLKMYAGANNPLVLQGIIPAGSEVTSSDSVVTVPIFDGTPLCPGSSCAATVTVRVVGFMQVFIKEETNPQGTVNVYITNIAGCGPGGGGSSGGGDPITSGGASPIPVRLIHN
ncbi:MAG TPA: pilus assembly protein TadG-related protein [Terriglobia bacterium]|nr:pilus assembly protein TadG-related protein [Terriglobia bacterium]